MTLSPGTNESLAMTNDAVIDNNTTTTGENYDYNETIEHFKMSIIRDAQLIRERVSYFSPVQLLELEECRIFSIQNNFTQRLY